MSTQFHSWTFLQTAFLFTRPSCWRKILWPNSKRFCALVFFMVSSICLLCLKEHFFQEGCSKFQCYFVMNYSSLFLLMSRRDLVLHYSRSTWPLQYKLWTSTVQILMLRFHFWLLAFHTDHILVYTKITFTSTPSLRSTLQQKLREGLKCHTWIMDFDSMTKDAVNNIPNQQEGKIHTLLYVCFVPFRWVLWN
jgi:preprotein translocase subunit SecE